MADFLVIVGRISPEQYSPIMKNMKDSGLRPSIIQVSYEKWLGCRISANQLIYEIREINMNYSDPDYSRESLNAIKSGKIRDLTHNFQGYFGFSLSDVQGCVESARSDMLMTFCDTVLSAKALTGSRPAALENFIIFHNKRKFKIRIN